ncbi:MAG TPA: putative Ig domain-containing protein, partial [Burkholderiales bacterium]|nr:putative Ig domain-containing protein [Burkholderiales bacterium]
GYWLYSDADKIEQLVFADGTVWGVSDIMPMISTVPTTGNDYIVAPIGNNTIDALDGNDGISSGSGNDTLLGGAGDDVLWSGDGSDILSGGSGADELYSGLSDADARNDLLSGGVGDDFLGGWVANELLVGGQGDDTVGGYDGASVILFNRGDGNDWIDPWSSGVGTQADTVSLGGGIGLGDLTFSRDGDNLVLDAGDGESIVFDSWFGSNWSDYSVDGNKVVTRLQIVTEAMPGYDPDSADPLFNKRIQQFDFVGLAGRFETALAGDPGMGAWQLAPYLAQYSLGGSDTAAIGGAMAYLYGKDGKLDGLTEAEVRAQLSDAAFGTASQTLGTAAPLPGSGVFDDVDFIHGDNLTYSATRADGSPLPGWLSFDAASGTFSGTPLNADVGDLDLTVSATDTGGLNASTPLSISVANVNDSPTAADDVGAAQEDGGAVTLSAASLLSNDTDPDVGDTLDIVAVSQPDSGATVSLLAPTSPGQASDVQYDLGSLYQSLGAGQTATDTFGYTIADAEGATSTANVVMTITGVNDAPVTAADFAAVQEDGVLTTTGNVLSNDTDVDAGTVLAVADAGVRQGNFGGLTLAADGSYSYTLDNAAGVVQALAAGQSATDVFSYGASDGIVSTPATLSVSIAGANDAPVVAKPIADQSAAAGGPFNFTFADNTFFDIDSGDSLAYTAGLADGTALPSWLSFDAATRTFSGTPPGGSTGGTCGSSGGAGTASSLQLRVYATDTAGASTFDDFALNVSGGSGGGGGSGGEGAPGGGGDDDYSHHNHGGDHSGNHGGDHGDGRDGDRHDHGHHDDSAKCRDARDTIAARLKKKPNYDFGALSNYLAQHRGGGYGALSAAQVAAQWRSVQARVAQLAQDDEDSRRGAHSGEHYGGDDGFAHGANFWGYAGSTGQNRGCGGIATFGGLDEGFRKLG